MPGKNMLAILVAFALVLAGGCYRYESIGFEIVDAQGSAVSGARVRIGYMKMVPIEPVPRSSSGKTDECGRVRLRWVPTDRGCWFDVEADGYDRTGGSLWDSVESVGTDRYLSKEQVVLLDPLEDSFFRLELQNRQD